MTKLIPLQVGQRKVEEGTREILKEFTEMVEGGEISEVCIVGISSDGFIYTRASGTMQRSKQIAALWDLLHDVTTRS